MSHAAELVNKQFPSADAEGIKCDVSKEADVKAAIDRAVEKWGRLDVLVSERVTVSVPLRSFGTRQRSKRGGGGVVEHNDDQKPRASVGSKRKGCVDGN